MRQKYAYKLQIWEIAQTGELFTQYDQYLERFVFCDRDLVFRNSTDVLCADEISTIRHVSLTAYD